MSKIKGKHSTGTYKLKSGQYYNYTTHHFTNQRGYNISKYWRQVKRYSEYTGLDIKTSRKYLRGYDYKTRENTLTMYGKEFKRRKRQAQKGITEKIKVSKDFRKYMNGQNYFICNSNVLFSFEYTSNCLMESVMVEAKLLRDYIYDRLQKLRTNKGFGFKFKMKAQKRSTDEEDHYLYHNYKKNYTWTIDKAFIVVIDIMKRRFEYYKMPEGDLRLRLRKL